MSGSFLRGSQIKQKKRENIITHLHLSTLYLVNLGVYEFRVAGRDILLSVPHCFQNQLYKHGLKSEANAEVP